MSANIPSVISDIDPFTMLLLGGEKKTQSKLGLGHINTLYQTRQVPTLQASTGQQGEKKPPCECSIDCLMLY